MIETLCDNEWLSLRRIVDKPRGVDGYVYSHETRCVGRIVVVLPFRVIADDPCEHATHDADRCRASGGDEDPDVHIEVLLRDELVPCWFSDEPSLSAITGGWEPTDDLLCRSAAVRELFEEAGYRVDDADLVRLGVSRTSKSSDTMNFLYAVDLTEVEQTGDGRGDGSAVEAAATCRWVAANRASEVLDPQVHVVLNRLRTWFLDQFLTDVEEDDGK